MLILVFQLVELLLKQNQHSTRYLAKEDVIELLKQKFERVFIVIYQTNVQFSTSNPFLITMHRKDNEFIRLFAILTDVYGENQTDFDANLFIRIFQTRGRGVETAGVSADKNSFYLSFNITTLHDLGD